MRQSATVLPKSDSGPIFKNRGIPTFPLGDCPHERVIPANSHTSRGRLAPDRPIRVKLPSADDSIDGKHWTAITRDAEAASV